LLTEKTDYYPLSTIEKVVLVLYGEIQAVILTPYKTHNRAVSLSNKILGT